MLSNKQAHRRLNILTARYARILNMLMPPRSLISSIERRWLLMASIVVLTIASLPYVIGALNSNSDWIFTGLQVNPLDGVSYLAKMRIGFNGDWIFHLPFSIEQGPGAYLFTFFIALGHAASILNLPLIVMFHFVRIIGGFILLWMSYELIARFTESIDRRRRVWWIVALSSGLGWLASLLGHTQSSDLSIPESNTFYSLIANAHFALATAIMIAIFIGVLNAQKFSIKRAVGLSLLSLLLAVIQPFAPFAVYAILGVTLIAIWYRDRSFPWSKFFSALLAGLVTAPLLLYIYLATQADSTLQQWSIQNQTPSPPLIDYAIGYGLLIVGAIIGIRSVWPRRSNWDILLIVWIFVTIPLLYAPIPLQRRLSLGLHIPIALLAAYGIDRLIHAKWSRGIVIAVTCLTSFFLLIGFIGGAVNHDSHIYLSSNESAAFNWLAANAQPNDIVLASPDLSLFIPAFAGQRVVYGHPYETVNADQRKKQVTDFYSSQIDPATLLRADSVAYVLVGPRERALGQIDPAALPLILVFTSGDVGLYQVRSQ